MDCPSVTSLCSSSLGTATCSHLSGLVCYRLQLWSQYVIIQSGPTTFDPQQPILIKLAGYQIYVRGPHVARGPAVGPNCHNLLQFVTILFLIVLQVCESICAALSSRHGHRIFFSRGAGHSGFFQVVAKSIFPGGSQ